MILTILKWKIQKLSKLLSQGDCLQSVNLQDAYNLIPTSNKSKKILRFSLRDTLF